MTSYFLPEILLGDVVLVVVVFVVVVVVVAVVVLIVVLIVADEVPLYPSGGNDVKIIEVAEN